MSFNEFNTVENLGRTGTVEPMHDAASRGTSVGGEFMPSRWSCVPVLQVPCQTDPVKECDCVRVALTELFMEAKSKGMRIIVERIVADIDDIVKKVRFDGWKNTTQGEYELQQALRLTLLKYKLHTDKDLFDKAYSCIRQYY